MICKSYPTKPAGWKVLGALVQSARNDEPVTWDAACSCGNTSK